MIAHPQKVEGIRSLHLKTADSVAFQFISRGDRRRDARMKKLVRGRRRDQEDEEENDKKKEKRQGKEEEEKGT